jgi:alcohol dehydrogenase class IV
MAVPVTVFRMLTRVIFGNNGISQIGVYINDLKGRKILVVTDEGIVNAGILEKLLKYIKESNYPFEIYDKVEPNPSIININKGLEVARDFGPDLIIAIGGGSPIDVAKAINILLTNGGSIKDYTGIEKVTKKTLPLIAIPTTCGTGSEVTWSTVVTDNDEQFKFSVLSKYNMPDIAIVDPVLMTELPPKLIASTGMDALTHAIESYVSVKSQPMSEAYALHAIGLISNNLRQGVLYQDNLEYIGNLAIASTMAGAAFSNSLLGLVHAMAHPLGGMFDIPHGIANAILLPYIMEYNIPSSPQRFNRIALQMGEDTTGMSLIEGAYKSLDGVIKISEDIGIPKNLALVGMDINMLDKLVQDSMKSVNVKANPRRNTYEDIRDLFIKAYNGR